MLNQNANHHINKAGINQVVFDVDNDIKVNRAKIALETNDVDLIVEWLTVYSPDQLQTIPSLKQFDFDVVLWHCKLEVAASAGLQNWYKHIKYGIAL